MRHTLKKYGMLALALLLSTADANLLEPVLRRVAGLTVATSGRTALIVAWGAVVLMFGAGWAARKCAARDEGSSIMATTRLGLVILLLTIWAGLGGVVVFVRISAARIQESAGGFGSGASQPRSTNSTGAALLFLFIYLISGVMAFQDAFTSRNDVFHEKMSAIRALKKARKQVVRQEALAEHTRLNLANAAADLESVAATAAYSKREVDHLIAGYKQRAIQELASRQQSPAMMGVTSVHHPENPSYDPEVEAHRTAPAITSGTGDDQEHHHGK